ncbi:hypothetical protein [Nocardioides faecalis]|nr:hypothetical protein [Nocardioides faecalis]
MNTIIASAVGALAAAAVLVGGVNAMQSDTKPVSDEKLYSYSTQ